MVGGSIVAENNIAFSISSTQLKYIMRTNNEIGGEVLKNKTEIFIEGMTCVNCENRIERLLQNTKGVKNTNVSYNSGKACFDFDDETVSLNEIKINIEKAGYKVISKPEPQKDKWGALRATGIVIILLAAYLIMEATGVLNFFNAFPTAKEGMSYGALFLIGLLTSIHCVGMCGGINLSQCVSHSNKNISDNKLKSFRPSILYNLGRVISYTVVGGIVGALGSVISFSGVAKGLIAIIAGIFMIIMALNMWGVFPWLKRLNPRLPKLFTKKINEQKKSKSPLYVGLLNGLMPCGPLQAMQLFALSTGSVLQGAVSMFLFSMGTVPLMFGLGAFSAMLTKKFQKRMKAVSAALVLLLGIAMFSNGMSLSGFLIPDIAGNGISETAEIKDDIQVVRTELSAYKYPTITVKKGVPVKWIIVADESNLNSCNNEILIPKYNIDKKLELGENTIEFTPTESGIVPFSCWMGMIKSQININN